MPRTLFAAIGGLLLAPGLAWAAPECQEGSDESSLLTLAKGAMLVRASSNGDKTLDLCP